MSELQDFVNSVAISADVFDLRPDCKVLVVGIDEVVGGPSDATSQQWLANAAKAVENRADPQHLERHLDQWREAYRAFGAKPQKFRSSVDALTRRSPELPQVNRVVDAYNAVSVTFGLPIGGENIDAYNGPLRLIRADGSETFDTIAGGEPASETVDAGEVIWRDDTGVTCRRWNWRQCVRTRVEADTSRVFFLLESLDEVSEEELRNAGDVIIERVASDNSQVVSRLLAK